MAIPLTTTQLTSSEDYFRQVVFPNKEAFFGHQSTFSSALNLATCLFHFHEWLYDEFKSPLEAHFGRSFAKKGDFWGAVLKTDKRFGYVRDVTNASKHVRISGTGLSGPSTGMSHIANTHIVELGFGGGGYGRGRYGDGKQVMFDDGGVLIGYDECATALFSFWKTLLENLTGRSQPG